LLKKWKLKKIIDEDVNSFLECDQYYVDLRSDDPINNNASDSEGECESKNEQKYQ